MRQILLSGLAINVKTGKDIKFKIPASISAASIRALSESIMVESFIHDKTEYKMDETGPLNFGVFILERIQRTPEHDALLDDYRSELAVIYATCESPAAQSEAFLSLAETFHRYGLNHLAVAAEESAHDLLSKGKKKLC